MSEKKEKKELFKFDELNPKSQERITSTLKRLDNHGITTTQAKKMSNKELAEKLDYEPRSYKNQQEYDKKMNDSMNSVRRNVNSITANRERREKTIDYQMEKEKIPKYSKPFKVRKRELVKTAGNKYYAVLERVENKEFQKKHGLAFKDYYFIPKDKTRKDIIKSGQYRGMVKSREEYYYVKDLIAKVSDNKLEGINEWEKDLVNEFESP